MAEVGLQLHPDKTRIVYCKDRNRRRTDCEHTSFTFLGYTFRARQAPTGDRTSMFSAFLPAVSKDALKRMNEEVRDWRIHLRTAMDLDELAAWINPVVRGWMTYYGKFHRTALNGLLQRINTYLVRWARRKYKRLRTWAWMTDSGTAYRWDERSNGRLSRSVLWEPGVRFPRAIRRPMTHDHGHRPFGFSLGHRKERRPRRPRRLFNFCKPWLVVSPGGVRAHYDEGLGAVAVQIVWVRAARRWAVRAVWFSSPLSGRPTGSTDGVFSGFTMQERTTGSWHGNPSRMGLPVTVPAHPSARRKHPGAAGRRPCGSVEVPIPGIDGFPVPVRSRQVSKPKCSRSAAGSPS